MTKPLDETTKYQPILHTRGDPQPRLSDGVYRAIRSDGAGGFEGIPMEDIVDRLNAACVGHPAARISWPHRLLHDAVAEIGRLRSIVRVNLLRHVPDATHAAIDALLRETPVPEIEQLRAALREIGKLDGTNCGWAPGMARRVLGVGTESTPTGFIGPKLTERALEVAINGQ